MLDMTKVSADWQRFEFMGLYSAMQRAAHLMLDHDPWIFEDPLALRIMGAEAESEVRLNLAHLRSLFGRSLRASMMARNRYTEDELVRFILRGVRQYIILGAGLDTFAYRNSFEDLRVFEVDYPDTQAWKRSCLEKAAIPIPASVAYVSVDFDRQMMTDALRQSGFKSDELTFVSFVGVVRYLSREVVISVLTSIVSSMPAGSEVVFDFAPPSQLQRLRELAEEVIVNRRSRNSRFRPTYLDVAPLTRDLKRIGFADVQLVGPKELNARYCKHRTDGLRIQNRMHLVKARV